MNLKKGVNAYRTFHGKNPTKAKTGNFYVPKQLIELGDAVEITYRSDKFNGGGDGKKALYVHKFSRGTKLYMDERRRTILYIKGTRLIIQARGIVN